MKELTDEEAQAKFEAGDEDPSLSDEKAIREEVVVSASDDDVEREQHEDVEVGDHIIPGEAVDVIEAASEYKDEAVQEYNERYVPHTGMDVPNVPVEDIEDEYPDDED